MKNYIIIVIALSLIILSCSKNKEEELPITKIENENEITGKIIEVIKGDIVIIQNDEKEKFTIRLAEIKADELNKPYGIKAKDKLTKFINDTIIVGDSHYKKLKNQKVIATIIPNYEYNYKYDEIVGDITFRVPNSVTVTDEGEIPTMESLSKLLLITHLVYYDKYQTSNELYYNIEEFAKPKISKVGEGVWSDDNPFRPYLP